MVGKEKVVALVSLCLVLVFAGVSALLYVRTSDLEYKMNDLEGKINRLTEQNQGLQDQVAEFASIFSQAEQLSIIGVMWQEENANATFTIKNTGTSNLVIIAVLVNGAFSRWTTPSSLLSPGAQTTVTVTNSGRFTSGVKYEFTFVTASGSQYVFIATAP